MIIILANQLCATHQLAALKVMTKVCAMQSQWPAADRHSFHNSEKPESMARVQQENPIDFTMAGLMCVCDVMLNSTDPGNMAALPRVMYWFGLALAAMWAILGVVTLYVRTDWHSLTHQPKVVGKAFAHNLATHMAYLWSSYKGHHRLRHLLPEAYVVLKLVGSAMPSTPVLHMHVLLLLKIAASLALIAPIMAYDLRSLLRATRLMPAV